MKSVFDWGAWTLAGKTLLKGEITTHPVNKVLEEWWGEDFCLSPKDSLKEKLISTHISVWSMVTLVIFWLQRVSCPLTPRYRKKAFVLPQAEQTTLPFSGINSQGCHFVLSALLPALLKACESCTKPMCCQTTWQVQAHFSQEYVAMSHSASPLFHEVLSFHQATCVLL